MFAGVAGLRTHQSKLDVIGNNIANVNTWGFKAGSANFADSLYTNNTNSTGGNAQMAGGVGGINASQVGYGVQMSSISRDFGKSTPYSTGRELDVMIDGVGFLIVGSSRGPDEAANTITGINDTAFDLKGQAGISLSRVGILMVDNQGYLVDNSGNYIYGYGVEGNANAAAEPTMDLTQLVRIKVPGWDQQNDQQNDPAQNPGDFVTANGDTRYKLQDYKIMSDGTIVGYTASSEKKITLGKIALANVENVNGLESDSGYYYKMGDNSGVCSVGESNAILGTFLGGYLEMPNVDLAKEFSDMITTHRGYQANTKVITVTDEMLQELVNMKR